jgi:hypothetical protein
VRRKRDSIEADPAIVFAALAVTRFIECRTGWSIKKLVRTARRHRTVQIRAGRAGSASSNRTPGTLPAALRKPVLQLKSRRGRTHRGERTPDPATVIPPRPAHQGTDDHLPATIDTAGRSTSNDTPTGRTN